MMVIADEDDMSVLLLSEGMTSVTNTISNLHRSEGVRPGGPLYHEPKYIA